jgi:hypothetical protein
MPLMMEVKSSSIRITLAALCQGQQVTITMGLEEGEESSVFLLLLLIIIHQTILSSLLIPTLATSLPWMPMAMPMSAFFSAGESLTPSPVTATTCHSSQHEQSGWEGVIMSQEERHQEWQRWWDWLSFHPTILSSETAMMSAIYVIFEHYIYILVYEYRSLLPFSLSLPPTRVIDATLSLPHRGP